jgi:hypothetical protein
MRPYPLLLGVTLSLSCGTIREKIEFQDQMRLVVMPQQVAQLPTSQRVNNYQKYGLKEINPSNKEKKYIQEIILKNGTVIRFVEQIESAVSPETPTGEHVKEYNRQIQRLAIRFGVANVSFLVGGGLVIAGAVFEPRVDGKTIAGGAVIAAGLVPFFMAFGPGKKMEEARQAALLAYDASLMQTLNLCEEQGQIVDCNSSTSAPASTPTSAPTSMPASE